MIRSLTLLAVVGLGGCVSLVPPANKLPPRYTLEAIETERRATQLPVTLAISDARAEGAYNTSKIAVRTGTNEIRYLPDGEWSDRAPRIVSLLIERSFEEQGGLLAISDRVALPLANYILYTDIRYFEANRSVPSETARVEYRVRLENRRGQVLGTRAFMGSEPITASTTAGAAAALNAAAARAAKDTVDWSLGLIADKEAASGS